MEDEKLEISQEVLENLTMEELAELKVEVDDLVEKTDEIIEICDEALNS